MNKIAFSLLLLTLTQVGAFCQNDSLLHNYQTAKEYYFKGDYSQSLQLINKAISQNLTKGNILNHCYLQKAKGLIYFAQSEFDSAEVCFTEVLDFKTIVFEKKFEEQIGLLRDKAATHSPIQVDETYLTFWPKLTKQRYININKDDSGKNSKGLKEFYKFPYYPMLFLALGAILTSAVFYILRVRRKTIKEDETAKEMAAIKIELEKLRKYEQLENSPYHQLNRLIPLIFNRQVHTIQADRIYYFKTIPERKDYIHVFYKEMNDDEKAPLKSAQVHLSIKRVHNQMPKPLFAIPTQSYVINILKFTFNGTKDGGNAISNFEPKVMIPVTRTYVDEISELLKKWNNPSYLEDED